MHFYHLKWGLINIGFLALRNDICRTTLGTLSKWVLNGGYLIWVGWCVGELGDNSERTRSGTLANRRVKTVRKILDSCLVRSWLVVIFKKRFTSEENYVRSWLVKEVKFRRQSEIACQWLKWSDKRETNSEMWSERSPGHNCGAPIIVPSSPHRPVPSDAPSRIQLPKENRYIFIRSQLQGKTS